MGCSCGVFHAILNQKHPGYIGLGNIALLTRSTYFIPLYDKSKRDISIVEFQIDKVISYI
jgi:hypothetical protein